MGIDVLIVGGGSAGCVLAARLSEDPACQVMLLEMGGDGRGWLVQTPAATGLMLPRKLNNHAFETVPQAGLDGRRGYQPRGKALGGSSAINGMIYIRGQHQDYDQWAALGNPGWSWPDLLPYFRRSEHNEQFNDAWHGQGGPLNVAALRTGNPFQQVFLQAGREAGHPVRDDFNGEAQEGVGLFQVTQKHGERWSAARAYLFPHLPGGARPRRNLEVRTGVQVLRLLVEQGRVVGAEVRDLATGAVQRLLAQREVVLCAGALQSPQVLMLSGIGPGEHLRQQGVAPVVDLPGVGEHLQDHPDFILAYRAPSLDLMGLSPAGLWRLWREIRRYRRARVGAVTSNYAEAGAFLRSRPELATPDLQLHFILGIAEDHARKLHAAHGYSCHVCLLRPRSRGSVKLAGPDPLAAPSIDPAFYRDPRDLDDMVAGVKLTRALMDMPALRSRRHARHHEELFSAHARSDDEIRQQLRQRSDTCYHPAGTCRMGPDPSRGDVVDAQLRVHGVRSLRVVDASIMPTLVSGNTNAPVIAIAEKAADLIRTAA
ncbi:Choline dehydrogenase [Roseateles sp. YR242]|uniref:GMC family oxidoreductase n=1 Tax=Roseateles sp. YR242 TaxID=1855305 RepID=UPI0008B1A41A|nr:GMC family oxidoreductase N-terminal domain-containing protein [Roseateles sp. YR242]SEL22906.1 Choline dehydrogenase [Roseateles sp. YR242]